MNGKELIWTVLTWAASFIIGWQIANIERTTINMIVSLFILIFIIMIYFGGLSLIREGK